MSAFLNRRFHQVTAALAAEGIISRARSPRERLKEALGEPDERRAYLLLGVLSGEIPTAERVRRFTRSWRVEGVDAVLEREISRARRRRLRGVNRRVLVDSGIIVDLNDTAKSAFTTGIQRVARETVSRWSREYEFTVVTWSGSKKSMVTATLQELRMVMPEESISRYSAKLHAIVVPFNATLVLPEIAVDPNRTIRLRSIARYGARRSLAIGFDCIPVTTSETSAHGMAGAFSKYLSSLARFDTIVAISRAAATEFRGWKQMLAGIGLPGPDIVTESLPVTPTSTASRLQDDVRRLLGIDDGPVLLCVGSHEPRKNHLRTIHAAERAWRRGLNFTLVFIGGNSWDAERFEGLVAQLKNAGRKIVVVSGASDPVLWGLYRTARASVFCSVNEGFGLPIVESLSSGTPVITSDFGSMGELGEGHGALLVDPRDVEAIAVAMCRVLTDDALHGRLVHESSSLPHSTWDDYAGRLWRQVVSREDTRSQT